MLLNYTNITEMLINAANSDKGIFFIEFGNYEEFFSYSDLYREAKYLLGNLQEAGLKPADEVILQFRGNKNFMIAFWACILGKMIPVPVTFGFTDDILFKVRNIWKIMNNPFLLTDYSSYHIEFEKWIQDKDNNTPREKRIENNILFFDALIEHNKQGKLSFALPGDIAFVQFSSGSTNLPKGIINKHSSIINNVFQLSNYFKFTTGDRFLSWLPLTHDMGLILFHILPLYNKAHQFQMPAVLFMVNSLLWIIKASSHQATVIGSPNFGYKQVLNVFNETALAGIDLQCIRYAINSAESISPELCNTFLDKFAPYGFRRIAMQPSYGLAEATLGVSSIPLDEEFLTHTLDRNCLNIKDDIRFLKPTDKQAVSFVDLGVTFTPIKIVDNNGESLAEKMIGKIKIKGPCITSGYYNLPEETARVIDAEGWLDTGDLGFLYNGRLTITGREKEMIIVNGQNYYPQDIEQVIEKFDLLKSGQVVITNCLVNEYNREGILCFVLFDDTLAEFIKLAGALKRYIGTNLGIMLTDIIPIKNIPRTTSGKIQRYKLTRAYMDGEYNTVMDEIRAYAQTQEVYFETEFYKQLKNTPCPGRELLLSSFLRKAAGDIIKAPDYLAIDKDKALVEQGLDSPSALALRNKLVSELGIDLPPTLLFHLPTIRQLTRHLLTRMFGEEKNASGILQDNDTVVNLLDRIDNYFELNRK